jgi:hypothetical protein
MAEKIPFEQNVNVAILKFTGFQKYYCGTQ